MIPLVDLSPRALAFFIDHEGVSGCWVWPHAKNPAGYGTTKVRGKTWLVHRLSWGLIREQWLRTEQFLCHRCDVRACANPEHLFVGTQADNISDAKSKGRMAVGERVANARLTADDVRAIRSSTERQTVLAARYGVGQTTIAAVKSRQNWRHIP